MFQIIVKNFVFIGVYKVFKGLVGKRMMHLPYHFINFNKDLFLELPQARWRMVETEVVSSTDEVSRSLRRRLWWCSHCQ